MKRIERWVMGRVADRALKRVGVMEKGKILEALGAGEESPLVKAVLNLAAGREQEAREMCSMRVQNAEDLRFNSGKLADAVEFQEELIALVTKASQAKKG
jgi:hypothetical protein